MATFVVTQLFAPILLAQPVQAATGGPSGPSKPVSNTGVIPTLYVAGDEYPGGNVNCSQLGFSATTTRNNYSGGNFADSWPTGLSVSTDGTYVSWSSTFGIGAVIVKGGDNANVYEYNPAETADSGLASPNNAHPNDPSKDAPYGLSNLTFCYNETDPETGKIQVKKFNDIDGNGSRGDSSVEILLEDWTIRIYDDQWSFIESIETTDDGYQTSSELELGTYYVCEVNQTGWEQTLPDSSDVANLSGEADEADWCYEVNVSNDGQTYSRTFGNHENEVDFCDPTQKPGGMSIAQWLKANDFDGSDCFEIKKTEVQECGYFNVIVTKYPTKDGWAPYAAVYTTDGSVVYPANSFPANFAEDENGGSVDVTWYLVGPESDYLKGFDLPNFWDEEGETIKVDTDCKDPIRIRVDKLIDEDGDLTTTDDRKDAPDWSFTISGPTDVGLVTTQGNGSTVPQEIKPGEYSVTEIVKDGYELLNAECVEHSSKNPVGNFDAENDEVDGITASDEDILCTFINAEEKENPKVLVIKQTDPHKSDEKFEFIVWNNREKVDYFKLDTNWKNDDYKSYHVTEVEPGKVSVFEKPDKDWMTKYRCFIKGDYQQDQFQTLFNNEDKDDYTYRNLTKKFDIDYGETLVCKFVNTQKAEIEVVKYEDSDQDGRYDKYSERTLPGWKMFLDKDRDECEAQVDLELALLTQGQSDQDCQEYDQLNTLFEHCWGHDYCDKTDYKGEAEFERLKPNQAYVLSESEKQLKDGWQLSDIDCFQKTHRGLKKIGNLADYNHYQLYLEPGAKVKCFVGNYQNVELNITKSNDAVDALLPGQSVNFEIVVSIPEDSASLNDVRVYDLMPNGLSYVNGSARVDGVVPGVEPDYSGPGQAVWKIGDMSPGESKVLSYTATVDEDTQPGTYTNVAWTDACLQGPRIIVQEGLHQISNNLIEIDYRCDFGQTEVLGNTVRECWPTLENGINGSIVSSLDKDEKDEEEPVCDPFVESSVNVAAVLGEDKFVLGVLQETGVPAILPSLVGLSVILVSLGALPRKSRFAWLKQLTRFSHSSVMSLVFALVLTMSSFSTVSAAGFWQLTVADLADTTAQSSLNLPYSVSSTSDGQSFEVVVDVDGPGSNDFTDTHNFNGANSSSFDLPLPVDGSYEVVVSATTVNGSTLVGDDTVTQTIVRDSDAPNSVEYEGVERTGNQYTLNFEAQDADKIIVYASTETEFTANESTKIGEVDGSATTFVYNAPDSEQRYFALVAVDEAGNRSAIVGDQETVVVDDGQAGSNGNGADDGTANGGANDDNGVVDDGAATDDQTADDGAGEAEGATDDTTDNNTNLLLTIGVLVAATAAFYYYFAGRREE